MKGVKRLGGEKRRRALQASSTILERAQEPSNNYKGLEWPGVIRFNVFYESHLYHIVSGKFDSDWNPFVS